MDSTADKARWVTCSRDASWTVSQDRHLVRRGHDTSACGATATSPDVWRANSTKPKCPACVANRPGGVA